ncbi:MAG: methyltransferase domain-containing protein [Deltaproteobacteria bacterium]|nr:methyltransferase domain-containing protein [Deltaproteobacteria bacterium]
MFDKLLVKKSFSRAAATYDRHASFQKEIAAELAELIDAHPGLTLDIGSGTGAVARLLKKKWPDINVFSTDIAEDMLKVAKEKLNGSSNMLVTADFERLPFAASCFDTALSSLSYQWAADIGAAFRETQRVLRPGGRFAFSTLGPDTMRELRESIGAAILATDKDARMPSSDNFAAAIDIETALSKAGFSGIHMERSTRKRAYRSFNELLLTLKKIGAIAPADPEKAVFTSPALLKEASRVYAERFPSPDKTSIMATYEVYFVTAVKDPISKT